MGILDFLGFGKTKPRSKITKAKAAKQKQIQKLRRKARFEKKEGSKYSYTHYSIGDLCELSTRRNCSEDYIISMADLPIKANRKLGIKAHKGTKAISDLALDVKQSIKVLQTMYDRNSEVQITAKMSAVETYGTNNHASFTQHHYLSQVDTKLIVDNFTENLINIIKQNDTRVSVKDFDFSVKVKV